MKLFSQRMRTLAPAVLVMGLTWSLMPVGVADNTLDGLLHQAQVAYDANHPEEALYAYQRAVNVAPERTDLHFNIGALLFNLGRYSEALSAFNQVLQVDPNDQDARYQTGRIYAKLGRFFEAIAAFEMVGPASEQYKPALENIKRIRQAAKLRKTPELVSETPAHGASVKPASANAVTVSPESPGVVRLTTTPPSGTTSPGSVPDTSTGAGSSTWSPSKPDIAPVQEVAGGFFGPTGLARDPKGTLYVANYSTNTIMTVDSGGRKKLLVSGAGINGPVGMVLDVGSGMLYVANHSDNSIARVTPQGKVSIVATGLKQPYNLFLDSENRVLYVSQQETNSIARIQLDAPDRLK